MKHFLHALALLLPALVVSCTESPTQAERLKGSLVMNAVLVDRYAQDIGDLSGVTITIEGANRTATTDEEGYVTFSDLPAGTYTITLSKPGFSLEKLHGYQFVGGGTAYIRDVFLTELPTFSITSLNAEAGDNVGGGEDVVKLTGTITEAAPENQQQRIRIYLHMSSTVSSEPGMFLDAGHQGILSPMKDFTLFYSLRGLRAAGVAKGTRVHVVAYPMSLWSASYFDPTKRAWIETNIAPRPSPVASFIMP